MITVVLERVPLLFFSRDGEGWVLSLDGEHYTDAEAADVVKDYGFAGFVFTLPGLASGLAVSDSREQVARYAGMVETGEEVAKRLPSFGTCPDFTGARAEMLLADGHDPEAVRRSSELAGPFNDPDEVADRMNELEAQS